MTYFLCSQVIVITRRVRPLHEESSRHPSDSVLKDLSIEFLAALMMLKNRIDNHENIAAESVSFPQTLATDISTSDFKFASQLSAQLP